MSDLSPTAPASGDPYAVLGLGPEASADEIKKAYFALVRAHPPERDPEGFRRIRAAYDRLNTPERKRETDMLRVEPWPEPELSPPPPSDLKVASEDIIAAARELSDLGKSHGREDFREVTV